MLIRASHEGSRRAYGSPRIHRDQGHRVSRKRVIRLKQVEGLTTRVRKRFKCTTMSDPDQPVAANVLIELATPRVHVAGMTAEPDGPWVTQLTRNATDADDGFLRGARFLIHADIIGERRYIFLGYLWHGRRSSPRD